MVQFIASAWMIDMISIFLLIRLSISWVNMFHTAANCASRTGLISSSSMSFKVLKRVVWYRLGWEEFCVVDEDGLWSRADASGHRSPTGLGLHPGHKSGLAGWGYRGLVKDLSF